MTKPVGTIARFNNTDGDGITVISASASKRFIVVIGNDRTQRSSSIELSHDQWQRFLQEVNGKSAQVILGED